MSKIIFSTRELAILFWISLIIILIVVYFIKINKFDNITNTLRLCLKLAVHPLMLISLGYIAATFYFLYSIGIVKELAIIKDYAKLLVFALIPMIFKVVTEYNKFSVKTLTLSILKLSIIPLFVLNEYTFNFFIEVFLVLIATIFTIVVAIAETKPELAIVKKIFTWFLAIIGIYVAFFAFKSFVGNLSDIKEIMFWKKMLLEISLLLHIPLLLFLQRTAYYEQIMKQIKIKTPLGKDFKGQLKIYFLLFRFCQINKMKLEAILEKLKRNRSRIQTYNELDQLFKA